MKKEINEINVNQAAKTLATVSAIIGALLSVSGLVSLAFGLKTHFSFNFIVSIAVSGTSGAIILLLLLPVMSFIVAYLTTAVFCLIYNFTAKRTGGITLHLTTPQENA